MATLYPSQVFEYEQTAPSDTWVLTHGLGTYPIVDVYIDYAGELQKVLPSSVEYTNVNVCTIRFTNPQTGKAALA